MVLTRLSNCREKQRDIGWHVVLLRPREIHCSDATPVFRPTPIIGIHLVYSNASHWCVRDINVAYLSDVRLVVGIMGDSQSQYNTVDGEGHSGYMRVGMWLGVM